MRGLGNTLRSRFRDVLVHLDIKGETYLPFDGDFFDEDDDYEDEVMEEDE